jgi:hypothetical protein
MEQSNSQTYLLKILEIPGKSVTQQYIAVVKDKLDTLGLKHSINIVVDENLVRKMPQINGQSGGGDSSTFPYNIFEGALDKILRRNVEDQPQEKGWITDTYDKLKGYNEKRQGIFDKLFSYTPLADVPDVKNAEPAVHSNAVEPAESIESAEPVEPSEPAEPSEPSEPSELSELSEPSEPSESIESIEPSQPSDNVIATNIDFPQNYSGVLYIQLIIYEQPNSNSDITLGLHELNRQIIIA